MGRTSSAAIHIPLRPGQTKISLNLTWLIVMPVGIWAIATVYVPIFGSFLGPLTIGLITALIVLLAALSLIGHVLVHVFATRLTGNEVPPALSLWLFGDAAQSWPAAKTGGQEALAAGSRCAV